MGLATSLIEKGSQLHWWMDVAAEDAGEEIGAETEEKSTFECAAMSKLLLGDLLCEIDVSQRIDKRFHSSFVEHAVALPRDSLSLTSVLDRFRKLYDKENKSELQRIFGALEHSDHQLLLFGNMRLHVSSSSLCSHPLPTPT